MVMASSCTFQRSADPDGIARGFLDQLTDVIIGIGLTTTANGASLCG